MKKALKEITQTLVKQYDPEKVILFGSFGTRKKRPDSDIDLLIIKNTVKRLSDRRMEVERILSDRSFPMDIMVYTPEEVRYLFSIGSSFIDDVMEKGRLLYMRKSTTAWVNDAEDELDSAVVLWEHQKYKGVCYHSQQAVEKILKALIIEKGKKPERTHDLVELLNKIIKMKINVDLTIDEAIFLNSIYKGRYTTEEGLLPHGELFWFSVNWTFSRFEINYLERRKVHEKKQEEAPQLHPRREGHHLETTSVRRGSGLKSLRGV
jgi:HEPN domain-containing protein/predicted nucleotidyltransferase